MNSDTPPDLPDHIEQSIQAIASLHADHHRRATELERLVDRVTAVVANPWFLGVVTLAVVVWIGANLLMRRLLGWSFDGGSFPWLQGAGELTALYVTALVLISQRRKDELSELREQLTLELAIMTEQKSAKLIELLEEMRRDSPHLNDRIDAQAAAMSTPADPRAVAQAFKETHDDMVAAIYAEPAESVPTPAASSEPASGDSDQTS